MSSTINPPHPIPQASLRTLCRLALVWGPLITLPVILNLQWLAMVAPNEEPKWAVFVVLSAILTMAGGGELFFCCREKRQSGREHTSHNTLGLSGGLFLLFLIGIAGGVSYATNTGEALNRLAFWCSGAVTFVAVSWAARHEPNLQSHLQRFTTLAAFILSAHFWYAFAFNYGRTDYDKFVQFTLIGHFNYTADVLIILIPMLYWTVLTNGALAIRICAGVALASCAFMLLTSGSLGGMGGIMAGGLIVAIMGLTRRLSSSRGESPWRVNSKTMLVSGFILLLLALAAKPAYEHIPKEYREQLFVRAVWWTAPKPQELNQAQELPPLTSLWTAIMPLLGARTPMWASTAGMIADRPWLGFGTGSYLHEYPAFQKRYPQFRDPETLGIRIKNHPHNLFLQIASENGLPLAILFSGLLGWLTYRVTRQAWIEPTAFWLCGAWGLWAAVLDAQVNHVFFNPASLFVAAVGFGVLHGGLAVPRIQRGLPFCAVWRWPITPIIASLMVITLAIFPIRWLVSEYYAARASRPDAHPTSLSAPRHLRDWKSAVMWDPWNDNALYGLAMHYYGAKQISLSEKYLADFLRISPHRSVALDLMATIRIGQGRLDEAEQLLKKALQLEPDAAILKENLANLEILKQTKLSPPESQVADTPQMGGESTDNGEAPNRTP